MKLIDKKVVGLQVFLFLCMGSFEILTPYTEGVIINQFIHKEASLLVKSIAALASADDCFFLSVKDELF